MKTPQSISIVIADNHSIVREAGGGYQPSAGYGSRRGGSANWTESMEYHGHRRHVAVLNLHMRGMGE